MAGLVLRCSKQSLCRKEMILPSCHTAPPGLLNFQNSTANNASVLLPTEALRPDQPHEPEPQCQPTAADINPLSQGGLFR